MEIVLLTGRDMPRDDTESLAVVEALNGAGVETAVLPWDATPAGGWAAVPLVVVRSTWDYPGDLDAFLFVLGGISSETRLVNPVEVLRWNSHKGYLLDLAAAEVSVVPTEVFAAGQRVPDYRGQVVVKPAVGGGARGTSLVAGADAAATAGELDGDVLVQPLIPSIRTSGEVSLVYLGGELSHAVRKLPADGDFRVQAYLGGRVVGHTATEPERAVAEAALACAPGRLTYARVDLVETANGPAVMELELVEPELFVRDEETLQRFAGVLGEELRRR